MEKLAKALQSLSWSDMDSFAEFIVSAATDDNGEPNDERYIARSLLEFATEFAPAPKGD